jgi:hypothetical protein
MVARGYIIKGLSYLLGTAECGGPAMSDGEDDWAALE